MGATERIQYYEFHGEWQYSSNVPDQHETNTLINFYYSGVVIRRVLDFDEEWDAKTQSVIKLQTDHDGEDMSGYEFMGSSGSVEYFAVNEVMEDMDDDDDSKLKPPKLNIDDDNDDDFDFDDENSTFVPWGDREKILIADLDTHGSYAVVAKGGRGGTGTSVYASRNGPLPSMEDMVLQAKPQEGETAFLELELKLIADIGLVGFPNAGKSSLLAATSRATPHIAPYPFTTLNPLVGYVEYSDGSRLCVADVPGLIQGASEGRGKGHDFLRHLERTKALLFVRLCSICCAEISFL